MRYGVRRIKKNPYRNFSAQWESGSKIIRTQQLYNIEVTRSNWLASLGHYTTDLSITSLFTDEQFADIVANYYQWKLYAITIGIKLIDSKSFYKYSDAGGPLTNFYWTAAGGQDRNSGIYAGFFKYPTQQNDCAAIDPDTSATTFSSLLETNCYKEIPLTKKPVYFKWYNAKAYQGLFTNIPAIGVGTLLQTAFAGSMPDNNQPHGWDLMVTNRDRLAGTTTTNEAKMRFQVCVYGVVGVKCKKPVDY